MQNRAKKITFAAVLIIGVLFLGFGYFEQNQDLSQQAQAQMPGNPLKGWAWSSNIGWVSFNCADDETDGIIGNGQGVCGSSNYSVELNTSNNRLEGYSWSSSIGWIAFNYPGIQGDLSSDPNPNLEAPKQPAELSGNQFIGYAKALGGDSDPNDGWDGWIKMAGSWTDDSGTPQYEGGVRLSGNKLEGFAWGGDVIGWLNFAPQDWPGNFGGVTIDNLANCNFGNSTESPGSPIKPGQSATLNWVCSDVITCNIKNDLDNSAVCGNCGDSGNQPVSPVKTTPYTLSCTIVSGPPISETTTVNVSFAPTRCEVNPRTGVLVCP